QAAPATDSGDSRSVVDVGRCNTRHVRAVTERIRGALAFDIVFGQNDFAARQVWMVGIDACIYDGNDDGSIAESGIPGLRRADELRRPLGDVAVLRRRIRC